LSMIHTILIISIVALAGIILTPDVSESIASGAPSIFLPVAETGV
jgi:hypothetical protein